MEDESGAKVLQDLPAISIQNITDRLIKLELTLPFTRTQIVVFEERLNMAHKECGDNGYVTLDALRT